MCARRPTSAWRARSGTYTRTISTTICSTSSAATRRTPLPSTSSTQSASHAAMLAKTRISALCYALPSQRMGAHLPMLRISASADPPQCASEAPSAGMQRLQPAVLDSSPAERSTSMSTCAVRQDIIQSSNDMHKLIFIMCCSQLTRLRGDRRRHTSTAGHLPVQHPAADLPVVGSRGRCAAR